MLGDLLPIPETGWKRYDEMNDCLMISSLWKKTANSNAWKSYHYQTTSANETIRFDFIGSKLRLISPMTSSYSTAIDIIIDEQPYLYSINNAQSSQHTVVFEIDGLENIRHQVEVRTKNTALVVFDAIDIEEDGRLLHPLEVLSADDLDVGRKIRCSYEAGKEGMPGYFYALGEEVYIDGANDFIPVTGSTTPKGSFYYLCVEVNEDGSYKMIADRNVQKNVNHIVLKDNDFAEIKGNTHEYFRKYKSGQYDRLLFEESLKIEKDITISLDFQLNTLREGNYHTCLIVSGMPGESLTANVLYSILVYSTGEIVLQHEYNSGSDEIIKTGIILPLNKRTSLSVSRSYDKKTYAVYYNNELKGIFPYTNNPNTDVDEKQYICINGNPALGNPGDTAGESIFYNLSIEPFYISPEQFQTFQPFESGSAKLLGKTFNTKKYSYYTRLLTSGLSITDKENDWDRYIVNSNLNGTITPSDNKVWNWSGQNSWCSTTLSDGKTYTSLRGNAKAAAYYDGASLLTNGYSFRPAMYIEKGDIYRYLIKEGEILKTFTDDWQVLEETEVTSDLFMEKGIHQLDTIPSESWRKMINPFTVLEFIEDKETKARELVIVSENIPSASYQLEANIVPEKQLILPVDSFHLLSGELLQVSTNVTGWISSKNAIPPMTAANQPSGIVTASSVYQLEKGYDPYKVFDGLKSIHRYQAWHSNRMPTVDNPEWIAYQFPEKKVICKIRITARLDNIVVSQSLKDFRFQGSADGINWITLLNVKDEPVWGVGEERTYSFHNRKEYIIYRLLITATSGTTAFAITELEMFEGLSPIIDRTENDIKLIVSHDNGLTWHGESEIDITNLVEVKQKGFTPEAFNDLTKEDWDRLAPDNLVRIGFYIEQKDWNEKIRVYHLETGKRICLFTPRLTHLSSYSEIKGFVQFPFYISRDDGKTWTLVKQDELTLLTDLPEGTDLRVKAVLEDGEELHAISYSWV